MTDFIEITTEVAQEVITSKMPADETIVEVRLSDGSVCLAWFSCNIMEAGDYDFLPIKDGEPDMEAESIADKVVAWRPSPADLELRV
jgi:hypothetical protein